MVTAVAWVTALRHGLLSGLGTSACQGCDQKTNNNNKPNPKPTSLELEGARAKLWRYLHVSLNQGKTKAGCKGSHCASERTVWQPYLSQTAEGRSRLQYYCDLGRVNEGLNQGSGSKPREQELVI